MNCLIPWSEKDYEMWRTPKTCSICKKPIDFKTDFWVYKTLYYHDGCMIKIPKASLDWRDMHG